MQPLVHTVSFSDCIDSKVLEAGVLEIERQGGSLAAEGGI